MKQIKPRLGIKWSLFISFIVFSAAMLVLLWLFQIVFLDSFYRSIKEAKIRSTAETLARNIGSGELDSLVDQQARTQELSIVVLDTSGQAVADNADVPGWTIYRIPGIDMMRFFSLARANGGSYFEHFQFERLTDGREADSSTGARTPPKDSFRNNMITYARIASLPDGSERLILIHAMLTPVSSTVETLRAQLAYVTLIMLGFGLAMALLLSRRVARPIVRINQSSKELARGNYQVAFEATGYKEAAELADTLNAAARELEQVEKLRQELIANVSHDLRTPLTMISGYAEVIRDLPGENSPENIQVIIDEARRLSGLVNDLLDLSRLQAGSQALKPTDFNLTRKIRDILARYNRLAEQEGFQIQLEAAHDIAVTADEPRIEQVLYNLINNAVNYTGEDKKVLVRQSEEDDWVRIDIVDSGEGIPAGQLPHIWERYYRVDKSHRRAVIGTGLGLSIVKGALTLHGAPFGVDSQPDQGSVFWFKLRKAGAPASEPS